MPIYEFNCVDCSKDSELLVRSPDWHGHAECPACGPEKPEKNISSLGLLPKSFGYRNAYISLFSDTQRLREMLIK